MKKISFILFVAVCCLQVQGRKWTQQDVAEVINRVNTYWQTGNPAEVRAFWDNAAYHTGNMEVVRLMLENHDSKLQTDKFLDYSLRWAAYNHWQGATERDTSKWKYRQYGEGQDYVLFGDWQICFQTYIDLYYLDKQEERVRRAREVMGYEADSKAKDYWWWADALYMVMPVMTKMYRLTGDSKYLDKLYENLLYSDSIMLDPETGLYFRDGKYVYPKHKSANGKKDFWARGDGWVLAGLAKVLQDMPQTYRHQPFFVEKYQRMAQAIAQLQQKEGYWTRSMMDPAHAPGPETSGTAFFTYGLLWGVNNGYLDQKEYGPVIDRAWRYLTETALQQDGRVGYVQPIGERAIPGQTVDANSQSNFGVGAFLLAACEYYRYLGRPQHTFRIGNGTFMLDNKPFVVKAAEVHYPRIPRAYWDHRIKLCKALGMNAICIYVFWNFHEQQQDRFCFEGQQDVAEFVRLCQKNDMWVIVRPGPYACAEWDMGGLPWWLLKKNDIRLREQDPFFMDRARIFEEKLADQLRPYAISNGGPIIMVQVENEFGSYGVDKAYMSAIRDMVRNAWNDSGQWPVFNGRCPVLFQCDWSSNFWKNGLDDLVWTMNFGTGANIDQQFWKLGEMSPNSPRMCSEFWSGWFDKWGARHETRPADKMVQGIDDMLSKGISLSLYMTHGGTSFGHWAGANSPGYSPDVTSYDYDAPINEYGQPTEKYWLLRKVMQKYSDKKLPAVPKAPMGIITVPQFKLTEFAPLVKGIAKTEQGSVAKTFEEMDMGWGTMIYSTKLPQIEGQSVLTCDFHDYAQVFLNGKYIGKIDRTKNERSLLLPPIGHGSELSIIVEGMGRINFGRLINDYKGATSPITLTTLYYDTEAVITPKMWQNSIIPDDYETAVKAFEGEPAGHHLSEDLMKCGYYRGYFTLTRVGDTFLNFERWGKGQVWVNGHALGRIWRIGPQQTLYVPGCWLKKGRNEIVVLDIAGPKETVVWGQEQPEINKLQREAAVRHNDKAKKPDCTKSEPVAVGSFDRGNGWQTIRLGSPQQGRYLVVECLSTQKAGEAPAIAELYVQNQRGQRIGREAWLVRYADSEDASDNHTGEKVFDLQESTYWQSEHKAALPQQLVIDLGSIQTVSAVEYLPRAEKGAPGSIKDYRIYLLP